MKKVVIVGGGVGGLALATRLGKKLGRRGKADITLIDKNANHFWKPALHEVAAGTRNVYVDGVDFRTQGKLNHFKFRQGTLLDINREEKAVTISGLHAGSGEEIFPASQHRYDVLVLALGSITNDFGTPGVKEHCLQLNDYTEAEKCRQIFLEKIYHFSSQPASDKKLNISIVGAGATGVELAAELLKMAAKLKTYDVVNVIDPNRLSIKVLEASNRILPAVSEELATSIQAQLESMGIEVLTGSMITKADEKGFYTKDGAFIESDVMVWTAGVKASEQYREMGGLESGRANQFVTTGTLQTTRDESIFAMGDCCAFMSKTGDILSPATAQAASQMSHLCMKNVQAYLGGSPLKEFQYKDKGMIIALAYTAQGVISTLAGAKPIIVKGTPAYTMHNLIYHQHQAELYGVFRSARLALAGRWFRKVKSNLNLPSS